eukprot:c19350_g1_i1 orf=285-725(-)
MAEHGGERRQSRRLSLLKARDLVFETVTKIAEPRKEIDPEEEPDFALRNPTWEDELPPIYPDEDHLPDILGSEEAPPQISVVQDALIPSMAPKKGDASHKLEDISPVQKRWKMAYRAIKKELFGLYGTDCMFRSFQGTQSIFTQSL